MLPLRPASLFRSRWSALLWAAGILWFANDIAGSKPAASGNEAATDSPAGASTPAGDDAQMRALENQVHAFEALK